jgi:hypothetical protein
VVVSAIFSCLVKGLILELLNTPLSWMISILIAFAIFITGVVKFLKIEKEEKRAK